MPTLLMNLRGVPDDEADEVRELLHSRHIPFYETPPSRWFISMGGIWLPDGAPVDSARQALAEYQVERRERMRADHARRRNAGEADTLATVFRRDPARFVLYTLVCAGLISLMTVPFLRFGG